MEGGTGTRGQRRGDAAVSAPSLEPPFLAGREGGREGSDRALHDADTAADKLEDGVAGGHGEKADLADHDPSELVPHVPKVKVLLGNGKFGLRQNRGAVAPHGKAQ